MAMPFASLSPATDHRPSPSIFPFCRSSPLYPVAGEEAPPPPPPSGQQQQHTMSARWAPRPATFTAAQYEELEQQALIYKYLVAGVPVPPDLLLPIRRGFDSLASRFYLHHAARTYPSIHPSLQHFFLHCLCDLLALFIRIERFDSGAPVC